MTRRQLLARKNVSGGSPFLSINSGQEIGRVAISCRTSMSIARLKHLYSLAWGNRTGMQINGYLSFLFHGRELVDEKPLSFYRIADGDVIVHNYFANTGRSDTQIDYATIADEVDGMAAMGIENEEDGSYDTRWIGGESWRNFPPVSFNNIWETTEPSIPENSLTLSPKSGPKNESLLRQARHLPHNVEITVEYLRRGTIALSKAMSSNSFIEWKATGLANYEQWSVRMKIQISLLHTSCCLMNSNEFGSSAAR